MDVKVFTQSTTDDRTKNVLRKFAAGISHYNPVTIIEESKYYPCDIAIFFGSWKDRPNPHHVLKNEIVEKAPKFIMLETPLLGRKKVKEVLPDTWYRIGLNGFLRDTGDFKNENVDGSRWNKISQQLCLSHTGWKPCNRGGPIVIALQIPGDASLQGIDIAKWAYNTTLDLCKYTRKNIIIRYPQLERQFNPVWMKKLEDLPRVDFQKGTKENLRPTLSNAWCTITYTSGLAVDSVLEGTPTIACHPGNFAWDISSHDLSEINNPKRGSTYKWLHKLAWTQWNDDEVAAGLPWLHLMT